MVNNKKPRLLLTTDYFDDLPVNLIGILKQPTSSIWSDPSDWFWQIMLRLETLICL